MPAYVHLLKGLDEDQSWELFSRRALPPYRRCTLAQVSDFEFIGKRLAKKCEGLPLALAVLGGYLSNNLTTQAWSDVMPCWPLTRKMDMMKSILARSYYGIVNPYLRPCLLYLVAFPEDRSISLQVLSSLVLGLAG
jgi:hypothetical protein